MEWSYPTQSYMEEKFSDMEETTTEDKNYPELGIINRG